MKINYRGRLKGTGALVVSSVVTLEKDNGSGKSRCIHRQDPSFSDLGINCRRGDESQWQNRARTPLKSLCILNHTVFAGFYKLSF